MNPIDIFFDKLVAWITPVLDWICGIKRGVDEMED
jgi:hypothetical protein